MPPLPDTSEVHGKSGRDEINNYPICRLPWAAKATVALKDVHRKPLMLQRFTYSRVNMLTKIGNRRSRRPPSTPAAQPRQPSREASLTPDALAC